MSNKLLTVVICSIVLLGFGGAGFAADDQGGTDLVLDPNYNIKTYDLGVYDPYPSALPEDRLVELKMDMSVNVPGMIILNLDVDNDAATGGSSGMLSVMPSCAAPGTPTKTPTPGFDIMVTIVLRNQEDGSLTSWCENCWGPATSCGLQGAPCAETGCFNVLTACGPGIFGCYLLDTQCAEDGCYYMEAGVNECVADANCGRPRVAGEWYASDSRGSTSNRDAVDRGRIDLPLHAIGGTAGDVSIILPLGRIVENTIAAAQGENFDDAKARVSSNLQYDVSTYYNTNNADDFLNVHVSPICMPVTDVAPDSGKTAAIDIDAHAEKCRADMSSDGVVGGPDIGYLLGGWNETGCMNYRP